MKKSILFLVLALLAFVMPSYAYQCKDGNNGSDECWVNVKVSALETTPVIKGTVLVADFSDDNADDAAWQVRVGDASADGAHVIGVAQRPIATGDIGFVQVRGKGKVRAKGTNTISSGDALFVSTSRDMANVSVTGNKPSAFSLQAQTGGSNVATTIDAYFVIV